MIETGVGNCHVYVDADADLDMALSIALNAKTQRTSVCNAAESLLVHKAVADEFVPRVTRAMRDAGVVIHADATFAAADPDASRPPTRTTQPSTWWSTRWTTRSTTSDASRCITEAIITRDWPPRSASLPLSTPPPSW